MPRVYRPDGPVLNQFLANRRVERDDEGKIIPSVEILQGPVASGKSVASQIKPWMLATMQAPDADGIRRSRWLYTRRTYPELKTTLMKTHEEWFPEPEYGQIARSVPMMRTIREGDVELEQLFMAVETEADIAKLRSLELTGAYVNELQYLGMELFTEIVSRCGRYPRYDPSEGFPGASWAGVIADMNAPEEVHFVPIARGDVPMPDWLSKEERSKYDDTSSWQFFTQPAGLIEELDGDGKVIGYRENPDAENKKFRAVGYMGLKKGKSKSWIDANIMNRAAVDHAGAPVYKQFSRETHVARDQLAFDENYPLLIGLDYGRTPAAIFAQQIMGRWRFLHELYAEDVSATVFAPYVKREIAERFPGALVAGGPGIIAIGDPAGAKAGEATEITPQQVFHTHGIYVRPAAGAYQHRARKEPVEKLLGQMIEGEPAFLLSPTMRNTVVGMNGGYFWQANGLEKPEKNIYSHYIEALEYIVYHFEGQAMRVAKSRTGPIDARAKKSLFSRSRARGRGVVA